MISWRIVKQFPKFFLVFGLIAGSTALFAVWWYTFEARKAYFKARPVEDVRPKVARIEAAPKELVLVDNDLYDLDSGAVIFRNWLKGSPTGLFYDSAAKKIFARYERGFVRYSLDGKEEASLVQKFPPLFADDLKWVLYPKEKDIWRADVDWQTLTFLNERKLTSIEQFNEQYFSVNTMLSSDKALIVRNNNQLLRVNLETGDVKPVRIPLQDLGKRRSPSGRYLVGIERGQFYCYDTETDETKALAAGKVSFNDYQWLGNDSCAMIAAGKAVVMYDRLNHTLKEVAALPVPCSKIGEPSPDGRFVFCVGASGKGVLVDLKNKTASSVVGGAGVVWVSAGSFAFSREVQDSELRGTWLQAPGESERRVSPEPYLVGRSGPMMMTTAAGIIVYATKHGLSRMRPNGSEIKEIIKLQRPPQRATAIADWKLN